MDKNIVSGDMEMPKFMEEGYDYIGEDEQWHIRDDAPDWAKREFEEFFAKVNSVPNEEGIIEQI